MTSALLESHSTDHRQHQRDLTPTMSKKKIGVKRRQMYSGPRRGKPSVRGLNREIAEQMKADQGLFDAIMRDAEVRKALLAAPWQTDPLSVYADLDQFRDWTEIDPTRLPAWSKLGQLMKLHLLTQVAVELGGYSFSITVRPDLTKKWAAEQIDPLKRIERLFRRALELSGLQQLAVFYVVEGASRSGKSKTKLHLHGVFLADDPLIATRFVVGMEKMLIWPPPGRPIPAGTRQGTRAIHIMRTYDKNAGKPDGKGRWASYIAKNVMKWDARIVGKRVFMSREATQTATEMWKLIRNEYYADQTYQYP